LVPLGMTLLLLQCLSELVKHVAFLRGLLPSATLHASSEGDPQSQPAPSLADEPANLPHREAERRWN